MPVACAELVPVLCTEMVPAFTTVLEAPLIVMPLLSEVMRPLLVTVVGVGPVIVMPGLVPPLTVPLLITAVVGGVVGLLMVTGPDVVPVGIMNVLVGVNFGPIPPNPLIFGPISNLLPAAPRARASDHPAASAMQAVKPTNIFIPSLQKFDSGTVPIGILD
jgi:hypothetical protein